MTQYDDYQLPEKLREYFERKNITDPNLQAKIRQALNETRERRRMAELSELGVDEWKILLADVDKEIAKISPREAAAVYKKHEEEGNGRNK